MWIGGIGAGEGQFKSQVEVEFKQRASNRTMKTSEHNGKLTRLHTMTNKHRDRNTKKKKGKENKKKMKNERKGVNDAETHQNLRRK